MNTTPKQRTAAVLALLMSLWLPATGWASDSDSDDERAELPAHTATAEIEWVATPMGADTAPILGDFTRGKHITYMRFRPGMVTPLHTHSADYVGLDLSGNSRHWIPGRPDTKKLLPAGSHWSMPAGVPHVSECLPGAECVMVLIQDEAFDFLPQE